MLGGAERSLLLLLRYLDRTRWQPRLACAPGLLAEQARSLDIQVQVLPMPRLRRSLRFGYDWLIGVRRIARLARRAAAGLVVANTVRAAWYAAPAARVAKLPFLWHMRDFWLGETRPRREWLDLAGKRWLCSLSARVIANSQATATCLPCREKTSVVPNGVQVSQFHPELDGLPFRRQWGIPDTAPVAGIVARLRPWKGQDTFLRAMAIVARTLPEGYFLIVGGDLFESEEGYLTRLKALARQLGLGERTAFTGQLEDVRPALAAMDVVVHAGEPEPFGLVNVEAMAMEKPVAAFAWGALPEIIRHGETGLLVSPGDEAALAGAVLELLNDPDQRRAFGRAGRARALECFTAERMAREFGQVLERCVSGSMA